MKNLILGLTLALATVITGCCKKNNAPKRQESCKRTCSHIQQTRPERVKHARPARCKKCNQHTCVCYDRHDHLHHK